MAKKHIFHREKCNTCIRMSTVDTLGRTITLVGTHAFEWSVAVATNNNMVITQFKNRIDATKEFNKYKRKK